MTIEEKARAYDEALERAKDVYTYYSDDTEQLRKIESISPELKESGDERIRKELIAHCENLSEMFHIIDKKEDFVKYQSWINWLEKQHEPIDEEKVQIGARKDVALSIINFLDRNTLSMCLSNMECADLESAVIDSDWSKVYNYMKKKLEKQGEKPQGKSAQEAVKEEKADNANKVEPKFHEGEWLCENEPNNYARFIQILETVNVQGKERYRISRDIHNDEDIVEFDFVEKYYHKFDIKDAKDGDVLFQDLMGGKTFIYNGTNPDKAILYSFIISNDGGVVLPYHIGKPNTGIGYVEEHKNIIHPATKEQRDLLFQRMKEAEYTFDFEKKKLKKIKQTSADNVEPKFHEGDWTVSKLDKKARQISEVHYDEYNSYYMVNGKSINLEEYDRLHHLWTIKDASDGDVLQLGKVTAIFKEFIGNGNCRCYCSVCDGEFEIPSQDGADNSYGCHNATPATKEQRDTLMKAMVNAGFTFDFKKKELKKIEKNPAWSEEDERTYKGLINLIYATQYCDSRKEFSDWLKSLKERYTWKPNDKQMRNLEYACNSPHEIDTQNIKILKSLYEDLKKLMGNNEDFE